MYQIHSFNFFLILKTRLLFAVIIGVLKRKPWLQTWRKSYWFLICTIFWFSRIKSGLFFFDLSIRNGSQNYFLKVRYFSIALFSDFYSIWYEKWNVDLFFFYWYFKKFHDFSPLILWYENFEHFSQLIKYYLQIIFHCQFLTKLFPLSSNKRNPNFNTSIRIG